jgi:hypothetical protein
MFSTDVYKAEMHFRYHIQFHLVYHCLCVNLHTFLATWSLPNSDWNVQDSFLGLTSSSGHSDFFTDDQTSDRLLRPRCGTSAELVVAGFESSFVLYCQLDVSA